MTVKSKSPAPRSSLNIRGPRTPRIVLAVLAVLAAAFGSLSGLMLVYSIDLPQITDLEHFRPSTITELYDVHGELFGSFALERRRVIPYEQFAPILREAVISIEDKNFESHWGVNVFRVLGAAYHDLRSKGRAQGASTLTMQLARNLFLSNERTAGRKFQEVLLSIQIERAFTKPQIFVLYGDQIYLGSGIYGFEAGANYFFSKHAADLTLPEAALLAGLPKGPSEFSPTANPDRALKRRNAVIDAMLEDGKVSAAEAASARLAPLGLHLPPPPNSEAPWFVEEVRRELERRLGTEQVHEAGLRVYTTLDLALQRKAIQAVLDGLAAYERRHGWRGGLPNVLAARLDLNTFRHPDWDQGLAPGLYIHALVESASAGQADARIGRQSLVLTPENWAWTGFKTASQFLKAGDIIYVHIDRTDGPAVRATLEEDSGAQGALMAMDNVTGDVLAMVGGRDFSLSQYNRATQAERQVGSAFKPYVYTAAVEDGATPEQRIADTPVSFGNYAPHDYEGNTLGEITLLKAFADSRNIPAVRLAERVGMGKVAETAHRFGITSVIPPYLPVALGSVEITLQQQVAAYAVFPNDGMRISPRLIRKVTTPEGVPLTDDRSPVVNVTTPRVARVMTRMLEEVIRSGTALAAAPLSEQVGGRLGGKTGTTSSSTDAWFVGFSPGLTCGVWVGYDARVPLGEGETGAKAALPIWIDFMQAALAGGEGGSLPGDERSR